MNELFIDPIYVAIIFLLIIWEFIWKAIALWRCGRENQLVWFIFILILNTVGILPIIYLLFFDKKSSCKEFSDWSKNKEAVVGSKDGFYEKDSFIDSDKKNNDLEGNSLKPLEKVKKKKGIRLKKRLLRE